MLPSLKCRWWLLPLLLLCASAAAQSPPAPSPVGRWVTIDDETGDRRSIVQIYEQQGQLFARVEKIFLREGEPENPTCQPCKGERKDQPILGMQIMWDMARDGNVWQGGKILDPEKGKTYRCKIWLEDGTLKVRGYWGPFFRTQTWLPAVSAP